MNELATRISAILAKLSTLSEAPGASRFEGPISRSHSEASPPRGFSARPQRPGAPKKDRSLYDWYAYHFARAADDLRRWKLVYLAEADWYRYRGIDPRRHLYTDIPDGFESEKEAAARIVEWYRGWEVLEVSIHEHCSPDFIKKARRAHRRSEHNGLPKPGWYGWNDERRAKEIAKAVLRRGRKPAAIADELDIHERTVRRFLQKKAA